KYALGKGSIESLVQLYEKLFSLEEKGRNRIWTRILRNSFAPLLMEKFDYVVGNPPWIRWEELPSEYREETKRLWEWYQLAKITVRGGFKKDISMLFVARCLDRYVKEGGKLAFLVPYTLFKTQAGAGFRTFLAKGRIGEPRIFCSVQKIHDMVTLYPFEGSSNQTSILVIKKEGTTTFPVDLLKWYGKRVDVDEDLDTVKKITKSIRIFLSPTKKNPSSVWKEIVSFEEDKIMKKIEGVNMYTAHSGVDHNLIGVFCVKILKSMDKYVLIKNLGQKKGERTKEIKSIIGKVEKELVFPYLRGRDVSRWWFKYDDYIILPHNTNGDAIPETILRVNYPNTYSYFQKFKTLLMERSTYRMMGRANPFYSVFKIAKYTYSPYRVLFGRTANKISATVVSAIDDQFLGRKVPIPDYGVIVMECKSAEEAYYLSAILNSTIVNFWIAKHTSRTFSNISMHLISSINIPKFNPENAIHKRLAYLSKKAHKIAEKIYKGNRKDMKNDLMEIEKYIDDTVAELYGITYDELDKIRSNLTFFKKGIIS
ncbi:MAG: hypothetical protein F7B11_01735, partial [Caldisphaeraceae archaeon]|nr:hypothetical protein [Caldisphaeraceae archaeon]